MLSAPSTLRPILIIDDTDDDMCLARRYLMKGGVLNPIVSFDDCLNAREYLRAAINPPNPELLPCVVFTDLRMPSMSGIDLIIWARSNPLFDTVRFVILSTSQNEHDQEAGRNAGADGYLIKFPKSEVFAELVTHSNTTPRLRADARS